jgi:predicted O-methyltransferase YrrM
MGSIERMRPDEWVLGLHEFCRRLVTPESVVVEIGSFAGESTVVFAQHAKLVHAIDPWPASYAQDIVAGCDNPQIRAAVDQLGVADMSRIEAIFDERVRSHANVRKMKARDADAVAQFADGSIDCVYIDSIHTYEVVHDAIRRWLPKVKAGGVCAGHDYLESDWPGVVAAVNEAFGAPSEVFRDTSWAVRLARTPTPKASRIQTPV